MADIKMSIDGLDGAIIKICEQHVKDTDLTVKQQVDKAGKAAAKALQAASPKKTGKYASGWKSKSESDGYGGYEATVYNSAKPGLTHLLEYGHGLVWMGRPTGKRVGPKPHMDRGYEAGAKELNGG